MLVLLDRDGVINKDLPEGVVRFEEFEFLPGAREAIALLTNAGFSIAICTNQSAIGKGTLSLETLDRIHAFMCEEVRKFGGRIDQIYFAADAPDVPSTRRKPAPGMLLEALEKFGAEAGNTPFVGDMIRDLQAAVAAGCPRILVRTGKGAALEAQGIPPDLAPVVICDDLYAAAKLIIADYC